MKSHASIDVAGRTLAVSNLEKVLYPKAGFTKGQVIDYYIKVSPWLLPHLKDRPISMKRFPEGVEGMFFYEKRCPSHRPKWMRTAHVAKKDGTIDYCLINELPSLVWVANLASLEIHTFLHKAMQPEHPTALAFDLDPGPPAGFVDCCAVALRLERLFQTMNLESFPKTSGSKGLQVYVPLNTPVSYEQTKSFAHQVALLLEQELPDKIVSKMSKALRRGKVFVDWSQNDDHKTTVCVYSLRAKDQPTVSTPLTWKEVASAVKQQKTLSFRAHEVIARLLKHGDLFLPVLKLKQKLPQLNAD